MEAQYKIIRHVDRTDYLEHAILKGSERKNHKYLAREWLGNKWKYFYTQAELNARKGVNKILRRQDSKEDQKRYKDLEKRLVQYKKNSEKAGKEIRSNLSKAVANGKKQISSVMNKIGSWTTKQVKEAKKAIDKGKKSVDKYISENGMLVFAVGFREYKNQSPFKYQSTEAYSRAYNDLAKNDVINAVKKTKDSVWTGDFSNSKKALESAADNKRKSNYFKNYSEDENTVSTRVRKDLAKADIYGQTLTKSYHNISTLRGYDYEDHYDPQFVRVDRYGREVEKKKKKK